MTRSVLQEYGFDEKMVQVKPFGSGLINHTWKVLYGAEEYILQKINNAVFTEPDAIAHNLLLIDDYLRQHYPEYLFVAPVSTPAGATIIYKKESGYYRLFPFVAGSHSKDVAETPAQAYEAAAQFGRFTSRLSGLDVNQLRITIPFFHDLPLRYSQFLFAIENGNRDRIKESDTLIKKLASHSGIVTKYNRIRENPAFKKRVTHHDTKINNVLFDKNDKGICIIDLDTVMPGYFISDVGDMMRTYLCPVSEEESDINKIEVREDFYQAIVEGYYSEMEGELSAEEVDCFFYAGTFMIYMQALRFLTDYLNNDQYYGAKYPQHNLVRAGNQATLLERLLDKESLLHAYSKSFVK